MIIHRLQAENTPAFCTPRSYGLCSDLNEILEPQYCSTKTGFFFSRNLFDEMYGERFGGPFSSAADLFRDKVQFMLAPCLDVDVVFSPAYFKHVFIDTRPFSGRPTIGDPGLLPLFFLGSIPPCPFFGRALALPF